MSNIISIRNSSFDQHLKYIVFNTLHNFPNYPLMWCSVYCGFSNSVYLVDPTRGLREVGIWKCSRPYIAYRNKLHYYYWPEPYLARVFERTGNFLFLRHKNVRCQKLLIRFLNLPTNSMESNSAGMLTFRNVWFFPETEISWKRMWFPEFLTIILNPTKKHIDCEAGYMIYHHAKCRA